MSTIKPVTTTDKGDPIMDCDDRRADTFLIVNDYGNEIMRASTRQHAQEWIDRAVNSHAALAGFVRTIANMTLIDEFEDPDNIDAIEEAVALQRLISMARDLRKELAGVS